MNLREATAELHKRAEQMPFNQKMFKGELSKKDYLRYLLVQSVIFQCIEEHKHSKLHNDLPRLKKIFLDIEELQRELGSDISISNMESVKRYGQYLESLDNEKLYPHIYLNYLAIAYGGQMMKSKIHGSGRMYDFDNLQEVIGSIRKIQSDDWAQEVNLGYAYVITIFDELQRDS